MFIKKIKNWDNEEQVVMFKVGSPTEDCGKAIYELDAEHLIYHDGKNSIVYTYESGNIEVKEHDIITISHVPSDAFTYVNQQRAGAACGIVNFDFGPVLQMICYNL